MGAIDDDPIEIVADPAVAADATASVLGITWLAYGALAIWLAFTSPILLLGAPIVGYGLWAWGRSMRGVEAVPTSLAVSRDRLVHRVGEDVVEVARADADRVRVELRFLGRTAGSWPVLEVRGADGDALLEVTLWDREATEDALRAKGWLAG